MRNKANQRTDRKSSINLGPFKKTRRIRKHMEATTKMGEQEEAKLAQK